MINSMISAPKKAVGHVFVSLKYGLMYKFCRSLLRLYSIICMNFMFPFQAPRIVICPRPRWQHCTRASIVLANCLWAPTWPILAAEREVVDPPAECQWAGAWHACTYPAVCATIPMRWTAETEAVATETATTTTATATTTTACSNRIRWAGQRYIEREGERERERERESVLVAGERMRHSA